MKRITKIFPILLISLMFACSQNTLVNKTVKENSVLMNTKGDTVGTQVSHKTYENFFSKSYSGDENKKNTESLFQYRSAGLVDAYTEKVKSGKEITDNDVALVRSVNPNSKISVRDYRSSRKREYVKKSPTSHLNSDFMGGLMGLTSSEPKTTNMTMQNQDIPPLGEYDGATPDEVVRRAMDYQGQKYVWGGESEEEGGFDCSGFIQALFKEFDINLPRHSSQQSRVGRSVSRSNLQPGDIVVYPGHVALYVGVDQHGTQKIIHAPNKTEVIKMEDITAPGKSILGGRRVL